MKRRSSGRGECRNTGTKDKVGRKFHNPIFRNSNFPILFLLLLSAAGPRSAVSGIKVENAYVRTAASGMTSAAYFKIANSSSEADTLYDVRAEFCEMAQLHKSFRKNGMVGMKQVDFVVVPAGSSVEFKPGGYHVMLMGLKNDLRIGSKLKIRLMFRHARVVEANAVVKE